MENQNLPASTSKQEITLLNNAELFNSLAMANNIVQFPYPPAQLEDWCNILKKERPQATTDQLELVFTKFLDGRSKWNHKESLPNIIRGLDLLKINKGEVFDTEKGMKYRTWGCLEMANLRRIYENDREF